MGEGAQESFSTWFKGSVVRTRERQPLRVFHGTDRDFRHFRLGEDGIFFTACPAIASMYAEFSGEAFDEPGAPRLIPVHLQIRHPRRLTPVEWLMGTDHRGVCIGDVRWHRQRGYDGAVIRADLEHWDVLFHADTYVVFGAAQIRSSLSGETL